MKYLLICLISLISLILEWNLVSMWRADKSFAYGKNLDSIQRYADAYPYLTRAVEINPNEPTFRDELSYNQAILASILAPTATDSAQQLAAAAINNSNKVIETSPNSLTFWKTRTRVFYQLATLDPKYTLAALGAIQQAARLAPTDAKVHYNLGVLQSRAGQIDLAIKTLEETTLLKPDYRDAYYNLGVLYKETGDKTRARAQMDYILSKIGPDEPAKKWLEENP